MKRTFLAATVAAVSVIIMGLAARDVRSVGNGLPLPHDVHFRYYEELRPALLRTGSSRALCGADHEEMRTGRD